MEETKNLITAPEEVAPAPTEEEVKKGEEQITKRKIYMKKIKRIGGKWCDQCQRSFWNKNQLAEHQAVHNKKKKHVCPFCSKTFARCDRLKMHKRSCDEQPTKPIIQKGAGPKRVRKIAH